MNEIVPFLERVPVFQGLSGLELHAVADFLATRSIPAETIFFHEGELGSELYILVSGIVEATMRTPDGGERTLEIYASGDLFGEMSIIEGEPRASTCTAEIDCQVLVLSGLDFYRLTWDHPVLGAKILSNLSRITIRRLSQVSGFLDDMVRWGATARKRSVTDGLTGLFNRRFLEEALRMRFSGALPRKTALLLLDLDHFRDINAAFGAEAGDAVIANVAASIQSVVRPSDIPSRLAGDEFAVLLPDTEVDEALAMAQTVRMAVADLFLEFREGPGKLPQQLKASVSIGITHSPPGPRTPEEFLRSADKALYEAKEAGRNCVRVFCEDELTASDIN